jgi:DnaJ-class molecular chaperone
MKEELNTFKKYEINNINIIINDNFDGSVEYERWVKCKTCDGTGKDLSSKIIIRDDNNNIIKIFDNEVGCDFCNGSGKNKNGTNCDFCLGKGKSGSKKCPTCKGFGRTLGKQKLKNIKLKGNKTKIEAMGHYSKNGTGYLFLIKESNS